MFTKYRDNRDDLLYKKPYLLNFTQPNMAFTPREIVEQFASGEVIAKENTPTDEYYDDRYTDDDLATLVQVEDDFQARQFVLDFQIEQENETKTSKNLRDGVNTAATPPVEQVPTGDGSVNSLDDQPSNS